MSVSSTTATHINSGMVANVCQIFREITGSIAEPDRERAVIMHWAQKGWSAYEFRLVIEYQFSDQKQKEFYAQPGCLNLRMMLNPSSTDRLIDIVNDLKRKKQIEERREKAVRSPGVPMMLLRCGEKIPVGDVDAYSRHMNDCFAAKGRCFF